MVASVAVLEIALHVLAPRVKIAVNMAYDAELGHRGVENEIVYTNTAEYYNQAGFRERTLPRYPFPEPPVPGHPRIAVIGDSITQAYGIPKESRYTEALGRYLLRHSPLDAEVYNFGTPDYGTLEEYFVFGRFAHGLRPDLVLLQFLGLNDFVNNGIHFAGRNQSHTDAWRPYAVPAAEAETFGARPVHGLPVASAFPLRARLRAWSYLFRLAEGVLLARSVNQPFSVEPGCNPSLGVFAKEPGADWSSALAATASIAASFRDSAEGRLVAIYFPSNVEVVDSLWEKEVAPLARRCLAPSAIDRWDGERKFLAAFTGAEVFSLRDAFLSFPGDRASLYLPDGHLSEAGHRLAAEAIGRYLLRKHGAAFGLK